MSGLKRSYTTIILAYGLFLGWLLSFPYNGPVLSRLVTSHGFSIASFSLTYTITPTFFLIVYSFFNVKEKYANTMITWSVIVCLLGTIIIFTTRPIFWYPTLALMGVFSVLYIISWSYFYTIEIPIAQKLPIMSLVIITGNVIHYLINILNNLVSINLLLVIMLLLLVGSYLATSKTTIKEKIPIQLEQDPFPVKLIFILSLFLFAINLNGGLTFHAIYPSYDQLFIDYFKYYGILPYMITLAVMYFYGSKTSIMLPVFLGISFLGLSYLSFGLMGNNLYSFFITETLMQSGWALVDLVLWTLFGLVASIYGRPLKISGYAFIANSSAVFVGGLLGVRILTQLENHVLISSAFAIGIIFISMLTVPWINETIERDLRNKLFKTTLQNNTHEEKGSLIVSLPQKELLTTREGEITELLLQGYTNKQIAGMLYISENTMKTHSRNIYSKLHVANKRELLQLFFSFKH